MKLINIYLKQRPDLRECHVFEELRFLPKVFEPMGLRVVISDTPINDADYIICQDTGHVLPPKPPRYEKTALWCLHCHSHKHQQFAHCFESTFGADLFYKRLNLFHHWLPNGVGKRAIETHKKDATKDIDVGMVGQYQGMRHRLAPLIEAGCKTLGLRTVFINSGKDKTGCEGSANRPYWGGLADFADVLYRSKVWLNITTNPGLHLLNNRPFEALVGNCMCVTDRMAGQEELTLGSPIYFEYTDNDKKTAGEIAAKLKTAVGLFNNMYGTDGSKLPDSRVVIAEQHSIEARYTAMFKTLGILT